jgi:glycosyltransferase involved in cell wall biosynthesis
LSNGLNPAEAANIGPIATRLSRDSQKPVRVLAFVEALWPTIGPAKNLLEFAQRAARSSSANITIATFHRGRGPISNAFADSCEAAGIEAHVIRERFLYDVSILPTIRKLVARCEPDIIQTHAVKSHFLIRLTGVNQGRPWIAFQHGYTWTSTRTRVYNRLDRWSLPAATKVVAVCRPFADALEGIGVHPDRIIVQHNSVKPFQPSSSEEVHGLRQALGITEDTEIVLCVGRLSREKAQADLIQAVTLLKKEDSQRKIRFILAGEGPDLQMLKALAKSLEVEDWVVFSGLVSDLRPYYTFADLIVMPSHTEGSPNVLLEAMAAGLPIIATEVGGVPEIVTNGKEALLVEKGNAQVLAGAVRRLLADANLRHSLSQAASQRILAYSPEAYCDSILSLYKSCLTGRISN